MSWLDEAQQIVKQKQQAAEQSAGFSIATPEQREQLVRKLKMMYDNATEREIDKAINDALDRFDAPVDEKAFMAFLRTKLED